MLAAPGHSASDRSGWMWDLTIPGDHDFYIQAATTAILVHNCDSPVYRVIRPDEDPKAGLYPKDPEANWSIDQHVRFGSDPDFQSQYISTTRSLSLARFWASRTGNRIVAIDLSQVDGEVTDLSTYEGREYNLLDAKGRGYAMKSEEVLIQGSIPPEAISDVP